MGQVLRKYWGLLLICLIGIVYLLSIKQTGHQSNCIGLKPLKLALITNPQTTADFIVNGAKKEVIRGVRYDASYLKISYPNGDVPPDQGACTDMIIRSLRFAGYDLQKRVHEDMVNHFDWYPNSWGLDHPDPNIDHRRIPNLIVYFKHHGKELPKSTTSAAARTWQPGDFVFWTFTSSGPLHCGVLSNERNEKRLPLVLHNMGPMAVQEDCLEQWTIIGHYRYPLEKKGNKMSVTNENDRNANFR